MSIDVLVVDDEQDIRELISGILEDEGFAPRMAANSTAALAAVRDRLPSLVVLDVWLQNSELDGIEILEVLKKQHPDLPVVIISGHGTIETAVAAIKKGAYDFVEKPFNADRLILAVNRALDTARLLRENSELRERAPDWGLIGSSAAVSALRNVIERVADARSRVLISGPPGSGKEMIARLLHSRSSRKNRPFVVVSAASIAPERMEEELFGIEGDGGETGMIGLMERAHGGTLMFDEISDMPMETQGKILRVLVEQRFKRVGGQKAVEVDVRIVSTTSHDLLALASEGRFREDLVHRLNVVSINAPGLNERREDIPALTAFFVDRIAKSSGLPKRPLSSEALAALQGCAWPGNVRQLRNVIERTLILMGRDPEIEITCEHLPTEVMDSGLTIPAGEGLEQIITLPLREARERFEREYLIAQINRFGGNISRTAAFIGMERSALHRKLKALGVNGQVRVESA
ncbi:sigma-54-dependent transcriptional regulator [Hyphococcus sp.]|uniref:nitrogen assimilation response regulator NtrX n=1 Tax=Hyphococcus sp. TaxID=2038636 RepID=UPI002086F8BE|nr:MAG: sigma-54-dependent Fis family transcriptional regulator [Marinicaulis sp.]